MSIHFIPNDPMAGAWAPPLRRQAPADDRPASRAGFRWHDPEPEGLHAPGSPQFLFWQCRESALSAVVAWEQHAGPLRTWQGKKRRLDVIQDAVRQRGLPLQPNAFYDRAGFVFYESTASGKTTFAGASTDVVAHEIGHGLLDSIRPDLWDTPFLEVNAFHEAFGDCMALLTAMGDAATRTALMAIGLGNRNFVETTAEDLSDAVRRISPTDNGAVARRALNTLVWQLPTTLPPNGGPGKLINESHSFARVFTGCFWDLLRNLLGNGSSSAALARATRTAARLLVRGASAAPVSPRFFQSVGRAMTLADAQEYAGAHHVAIRDAFAAHGIALGSNALLAPAATLDGPPPVVRRGAAGLSSTTRRDLKGRLGARSHGRMVVRRGEIGGTSVVQAVHYREVPLGAVSPFLRGVVAIAPEGVLIGGSGRRAALLGALPEASTTTDEALAYVESLVTHDRIDFGQKSAASRPRRESWHSHSIRWLSGRRVLARTRFSCGG